MSLIGACSGGRIFKDFVDKKRTRAASLNGIQLRRLAHPNPVVHTTDLRFALRRLLKSPELLTR
jgi:hypothetical protein